jgi:hypothetical protein
LEIYKLTPSFRNSRLSSSERLCWIVWSITRSFTLIYPYPFFFSFWNTYFVINEEKSQISYITMYGLSHHQTWNMKLFLSCAGNFPVSKFIYKLVKIEKTNKQTKTKNKSRDLHKDCVCVSFWWWLMPYIVMKKFGTFLHLWQSRYFKMKKKTDMGKLKWRT